ncbi:hypothetical protein APHAL10511_003871 [Amanita phalloides]|nr:hypothetical protein APHAL10511_003871 [Amanita phalloides]
MPGPCNNKKKRKTANKIHRTPKKPQIPEIKSETSDPPQNSSPLSSRSPSQRLLTPPSIPYDPVNQFEFPKDQLTFDDDNSLPPMPMPYIHDPGNGPRVRDTRAFLSSTYFAQKPAMHIPLCAEFAQPEILEMLRTILPEETALILWYNKSRATSRICPTCQRLYCLGDKLPDLSTDEPLIQKEQSSPCLQREQEISGLCSPVCFVLASFDYPGAIKMAWGCTADEMDDETWTILNGPGKSNTCSELGTALGMLVKMTRLHDLGLGQLCFGEIDLLDDRIEDAAELPLNFDN